MEMSTLIAPLLTVIGIGAFLCGVALFHTVMMRSYKKNRDEETEASPESV